MAEKTGTGNGWAQIVLAIFVEAAALWAILQGEELSRRGIPLWILGVILIPFGIWLVVRGVRGIRRGRAT